MGGYCQLEQDSMREIAGIMVDAGYHDDDIAGLIDCLGDDILYCDGSLQRL